MSVGDVHPLYFLCALFHHSDYRMGLILINLCNFLCSILFFFKRNILNVLFHAIQTKSYLFFIIILEKHRKYRVSVLYLDEHVAFPDFQRAEIFQERDVWASLLDAFALTIQSEASRI